MNRHQATPQVLRAMLKKAQQKLAAARKDMESGFFGEASSRSYYAAFHAVSAVLAHRGLAFSSHAQTLAAFNREFVKTAVFSPPTPFVSFNVCLRTARSLTMIGHGM